MNEQLKFSSLVNNENIWVYFKQGCKYDEISGKVEWTEKFGS